MAVWLVAAALFLLLSLGIVFQPTDIPLPFAALRRLPGMGQFRTPYRFVIPATVGLSLAVGAAATYWRARLRPSPAQIGVVLGLFIALAVVDSRSVAPFALQRYPEARIYEEIGAREGDFLVLQVPVGLRSGTQRFGNGDPLQYYQTVYEKRAINAMVARIPRRWFDTYQRSPAFRFLGGEAIGEMEPVERDLNERLQAFNVGFIVVHRTMLPTERLQAIEALLDQQPGLALVREPPTIRLYETSLLAPKGN
ncbi:MAG: hypothetical protein R3272_14515 [Candidatus Promineifilaceae bacterium]|nr:hypothetical protein [Candidatus Promineifilaceae bacterium]